MALTGKDLMKIKDLIEGSLEGVYARLTNLEKNFERLSDRVYTLEDIIMKMNNFIESEYIVMQFHAENNSKAINYHEKRIKILEDYMRVKKIKFKKFGK